MDPNTFRGKVLLSFIDKIIIGAVALIVLLPLQWLGKKYEASLKTSLSLAKINTDILVKQRNSLIETMGEYFYIIDEIRPNGKADTDQMKTLIQLKEKVIVLIFTVEPIDEQKIEKTGKLFLESILSLNSRLAEGKKIQPECLDCYAKTIRDNYMGFLQTLREVTLDTVKKEYKLVKFDWFPSF
jgi:hypothetical protein